MTIQQIRESLVSVFQPNLLVKLIAIIWDALTASAPVQHLLLTGFAGLGKTRLATIVGDILTEKEWKFHVVPVGVTLSQLKSLLIQDCTSFANKNCFFFDEVHSLKKEVREFMKCMLDLGGSNKSVTICDSKGTEFTLELSCYNFMCIMATNQALSDTALKGGAGRLTELKLLPYSLEDRVSIFASLWEVYAPEMHLPTKEAVLTYCRNVRPFARAIKRQIQDCRSQAIANGLEIGNVEGARKALKASSYFPGGWTLQHVEVLQYLATTATGRQVQEVAAAPLQGATSKEAQEVLDELRQADFVLNTNQGRKGATSAGVAYLQSLTVKKTVKVTRD